MKNISLIFVSFFMFAFVPSVFAAGVDHFSVEMNPTSAQVGEALDITIQALDTNDAVVTDYQWTVLIFSESDKEAEFPNALQDSSYTFTKTDQGKVKFENGVKFKNAGKQNINVYDLNDDKVMGTVEVTIGDSKESTSLDISILSPENGLTIAENKIMVSGSTKKNHTVVLTLNNKDEIKTTSNSDGVFEKEIPNLPDGENVIKATVLDADNKKVGESTPVNVKVNSATPKVQSIKIDPRGEVAPETQISVEVIANIGLSEVTAMIDDTMTKLEETKSGVYVGKITAPKKDGTYLIDVNLKNDLGKVVKEAGLEKIIVKMPELNAAVVTTSTGNIIPATRDPLKITGLRLTPLKTKSILSWDALEKAETYNVYKKLENGNLELVANVTEPNFTINVVGNDMKYDDFYVKAMGKDTEGKVYEWDLSDPTKIQTGPELYLILVFISLLLGAMYLHYSRRKA